ncbi:hypothetical protein ACF0H5_019788 [Mactra antiquata]
MPGRGRGRGRKRRAETDVDNEERQVRRRLRSDANRALEEDRGENFLPTIDFETILCNSDCAPPQERGCGADTREQGGFPSGILPSSSVDTDVPHAPFFNLTSGMEINPNPFRTPDDFLSMHVPASLRRSIGKGEYTYGYWETASLCQQKETWSITRQSLGGGYGRRWGTPVQRRDRHVFKRIYRGSEKKF